MLICLVQFNYFAVKVLNQAQNFAEIGMKYNEDQKARAEQIISC